MLVVFFRFLSYLPLSALHLIGAGLGWLVYLFSRSYRDDMQNNMRQAGFTEYLHSAVAEAGKSVLELPFIWCARQEVVLKTAKVENWDVVQTAIDAGKGVIFLTPHLGCFEVIAQSIAARTPLTALYRPPRKKALEPLMTDARSRTNLNLAPANLSGVRTMLKTLKKGAAVGLLPDQVPQQGEGVWANFFGRPAYTMTLTSKLHTMTGAPIILSYAERLPWGRGFLVRFVPLTESDYEALKGTPEQQATVINSAMEKLIAHCPAQYFWSYNRYKVPANVAGPSNSVS